MAENVASDPLTSSLQIAALLAQVLPGLINLYDTIQRNHQNAGLTPASTLFQNVIATSTAIEQTAAEEIAKTPAE